MLPFLLAAFGLAVFDFAEPRFAFVDAFVLLNLAAGELVVVGLALVAVVFTTISLFPFWASSRETDTHVLALVAGQSERNQGESARIAAYLRPIRQFLPDGERILGLGSNGGRGAETADLQAIPSDERPDF